MLSQGFRRSAFVAGLVIGVPLLSLSAQESSLPDGWRVRADRPGVAVPSTVFTVMAPGWHITTGPSVILWNPATVGTGEFAIEYDVFFFREGSRDTEGYGVIYGARDLDGPSPDYIYVLLRNDGRFMVRHRGGADIHDIMPWTAHAAIATHTGGDSPTVRNRLRIEAGAETVRLLINGQEAGSFPRAHMKADGIVGLRVNHNLNLHVSRLDVGPLTR